MITIAKLLEIHQLTNVEISNGFISLGSNPMRADYIANFNDLESFEQAVEKCYKWAMNVYKSRFKA